MIKKNDIILIVGVVLIAIAAILLFNITKSSGGKVVITVDAEHYKTLDLNTNQTLSIEDHHGDQNIIEIKDGKVRMVEANCPDKICVKHKSIQYNHETIVCLPHKIVLEITDGEENEVDMIAK